MNFSLESFNTAFTNLKNAILGRVNDHVVSDDHDTRYPTRTELSAQLDGTIAPRRVYTERVSFKHNSDPLSVGDYSIASNSIVDATSSDVTISFSNTPTDRWFTMGYFIDGSNTITWTDTINWESGVEPDTTLYTWTLIEITCIGGVYYGRLVMSS